MNAVMSADSIKTVAVLGAGTMGNGVAHVFARAGYGVILRDVEQRFLDRGLDTISKNLDREVKKEKITAAEKAATLARLQPTTDMAALAAADFAVEAVLRFPSPSSPPKLAALKNSSACTFSIPCR
jgi:3-hydroxybutyryl-CoA dehydrogenase